MIFVRWLLYGRSFKLLEFLVSSFGAGCGGGGCGSAGWNPTPVWPTRTPTWPTKTHHLLGLHQLGQLHPNGTLPNGVSDQSDNYLAHNRYDK